jgi:hypothetical protein
MCLREEYEKETGKCALYPQMGFSSHYVEWLEKKVRMVEIDYYVLKKG